MTTASCRVGIVSNDTSTYHRTESLLEADLMTVLMAWVATGEVVAFKAQYGGLKYKRNGKLHNHTADLCVDFRNGARIIYVVRAADNKKDLPTIVELIRNYDLKSHAHDIKFVTDQTIPKPLVHKAEEILRARELGNRENNAHALRILQGLGGRAAIFQVLERMPETVTWAQGWTAIWSLINDRQIRHDHPRSATAIMTRLSNIQII